MSSAIKPPGGAPPAGVGETGAPRDTTDVSRGEAFRGELTSKAGEADATKLPAAASSNVATSRAELLRALADEVRSGQVAPEQAVERLVQRALSSGSAAGLPPARRAELETLLRTALAEDPTLAAMQGDLSRGR